MDTLAAKALTAHQQREDQRRAEQEERDAEIRTRKAREADAAMDAARAAFVHKLAITSPVARELVHVDHSLHRGVIQHVVVAVPVDGLTVEDTTLIVNWPDGKPQIAVCAHRRGWAPSYGKRIDSMADLGQLIADRREARDRHLEPTAGA